MPYIPVDLTTPWLAYWGALLLAVGVGAWRHVEGLHAFEANVRTKYGVDHVERVRQSGSGLTADLVHPDGTVERDVYLALDPTGEPFHGEDLALGTPGPRG